MSNPLTVNETADVSSEDHSTLPQPVTVLQAADIPKASPEALHLLESIVDDDLQQCLQSESLSIMSDDEPTLVGSMSVRLATRVELRGPPTLIVCVESSGKISGSRCGTVISARLSLRLDTLEQRVQEFVKLSGSPMKRVTDIYRQDEFYKVVQTVSRNEETDVSEYFIPLENSAGLITEAGNLVLQKLLAMKGVPNNCVFIGLDQSGRVCPVTYTSLEKRRETVEDLDVEVLGIQRVMKPTSGDPVVWHSYYTVEGGCLVSRKVVDSPVTTRVTTIPPLLLEHAQEEVLRQQYSQRKKNLHWETDLELHSKFLDRKRQLTAEHASYASHNSDLRALLSDFVQHLLIDKPSDVLDFCTQYFDAFSAAYSEVEITSGSGAGRAY